MSSVPRVSAPRTHILCETVTALPDSVTGEVIRRQLHAFPRPSACHGSAASSLDGDPVYPRSRDRGRPDGWWIIGEPEVHFVRDVELRVPDIGALRRERMPGLPDERRFGGVPDRLSGGDASIRVAPFDAIEISSPWE